MNYKKHFTSVLAVFISVCAFAYPAPSDENHMNPFLQQYAAQQQELQKEFEQKLLPPIKDILSLASQVQTEGQAELSAEQGSLLEKYALQLDKNLTDIVAPALKDLDLKQFNEKYAQMAKIYGLPEQTFTLQDVEDLLKGMYLVSALSYFEQAQKLNTDELALLTEIFFPQEAETQENQ